MGVRLQRKWATARFGGSFFGGVIALLVFGYLFVNAGASSSFQYQVATLIGAGVGPVLLLDAFNVIRVYEIGEQGISWQRMAGKYRTVAWAKVRKVELVGESTLRLSVKRHGQFRVMPSVYDGDFDALVRAALEHAHANDRPIVARSRTGLDQGADGVRAWRQRLGMAEPLPRAQVRDRKG